MKYKELSDTFNQFDKNKNKMLEKDEFLTFAEACVNNYKAQYEFPHFSLDDYLNSFYDAADSSTAEDGVSIACIRREISAFAKTMNGALLVQ